MTPQEKSKNLTLKRKLKIETPIPRKKAKIERTVNELPWKSVKRPQETGLSGGDGILELEEVEGVEVVYENTGGGRVIKFNVLENDGEKDVGHEDYEASVTKSSEPEDEVAISDDTPPFDSGTLLPEWHGYSLHPRLEKALHSKGFCTPTPIQSAALPFALAGRDVIGVAQTGSGKTLAYGLPILHHLLSQPRPSPKKKRELKVLVLAPTRELALQISSHLIALLEPPSTESGNLEETIVPGEKPPPHVSIAAIVGGMSAQKQRRILDRGVDVLIATPGRLWDIMGDDDVLAAQIKNIRFLVLDEADRMIEAGHFAELENILRLTLRESRDDQIPEEPQEGETFVEEEGTKEGTKSDLQTFVVSATLSRDLQHNLKRHRSKGSKLSGKRHQAPLSTLDDLLYRLDFRDANPEVIDLSPVGGVVSTLQEGRINCLTTDKDVYLYYFFLRYPGRTLVFLSSIDGIRRLLPLLELLNIKAFPLHSQMEQRQRLKNLDRFKTIQNSVLLATDIAARGLDISAVDHVIHFQIPRTAETYIHRNGRTARAMRKGFSMLMCAPDERRIVRALMASVGREESEIEEMSLELSMLDKLKARVQLARNIENQQHKVKKINHDRTWMQETAETLGVELDSDYLSDNHQKDNVANQKRKAREAKMKGLRSELKHLLSQPLIARGVHTKYITSGSRPIVDDLLAGEHNDSMVGLKKSEAGSEMLKTQAKKKKVVKAQVQEEEEEEEWTGIS